MKRHERNRIEKQTERKRRRDQNCRIEMNEKKRRKCAKQKYNKIDATCNQMRIKIISRERAHAHDASHIDGSRVHFKITDLVWSRRLLVSFGRTDCHWARRQDVVWRMCCFALHAIRSYALHAIAITARRLFSARIAAQTANSRTNSDRWRRNWLSYQQFSTDKAKSRQCNEIDNNKQNATTE